MPTPDRQKVNVRMSAQEKTAADLQLASARLAMDRVRKKHMKTRAAAAIRLRAASNFAKGAEMNRWHSMTDREKRTHPVRRHGHRHLSGPVRRL